jgi:hypothetical protein
MPTMKNIGRLLGAASLTLLLSAADAGPLVFTAYHADGRYALGETVGWTVRLAPGAERQPGSYSYTVVTNEKAVLKTGSFDLASGSAAIEALADHAGKLRVIVDYLAPPPPPPPSPAEIKAVNAAVRALILKADPSLKDVLAKYPDYQFVHPPIFNFKALEEDRVATLAASISAP